MISRIWGVDFEHMLTWKSLHHNALAQTVDRAPLPLLLRLFHETSLPPPTTLASSNLPSKQPTVIMPYIWVAVDDSFKHSLRYLMRSWQQNDVLKKTMSTITRRGQKLDPLLLRKNWWSSIYVCHLVGWFNLFCYNACRVIREVVMVNFFENFCSAMEPMLRRVVTI